MDYRLYTALFYLSKGNYKAFYDLICTKGIKELKLQDSEDLIKLHTEGYIEYKKYNKIFITKKGEEVLTSKNKKPSIQNDKISIDDAKLDEFIIGFPPDRYGKRFDIMQQLQIWVDRYDHNWDLIIQAKQQYIAEKAEQNFLYTMSVINFINKKLEDYCRAIILNQSTNKVTNGGLFMD